MRNLGITATLEKFDLYNSQKKFLEEINKANFPVEMDEAARLHWKQAAVVILFCIESYLKKIRIYDYNFAKGTIEVYFIDELMEGFFPEQRKNALPSIPDVMATITSWDKKRDNSALDLFPNDTAGNLRLSPLIGFLVNFLSERRGKILTNNFSLYLNKSFASGKASSPIRLDVAMIDEELNRKINPNKFLPVIQIVERELKDARKKLENFVLFRKIQILKTSLSRVSDAQHLILIILLFIENYLKKKRNNKRNVCRLVQGIF